MFKFREELYFSCFDSYQMNVWMRKSKNLSQIPSPSPCRTTNPRETTELIPTGKRDLLKELNLQFLTSCYANTTQTTVNESMVPLHVFIYSWWRENLRQHQPASTWPLYHLRCTLWCPLFGKSFLSYTSYILVWWQFLA